MSYPRLLLSIGFQLRIPHRDRLPPARRHLSRFPPQILPRLLRPHHHHLGLGFIRIADAHLLGHALSHNHHSRFLPRRCY